MRIVVTGGAGFIGSHLCDHYINEGHDVIAVDNFVTGSQANVAHLSDNPKFMLIDHDICTPMKIDGTVDAVFNLASPASPPQYLELPIETMRAGAEGTYHCLELAREKGASFLIASTSEVYGDPLEHPQRESYSGNVDPIGPRSVYDEAKRYAESMTMAFHRKHKMNTHIIRIFNTYGPRMNPEDGRVVPNFIIQALRQQPLTVYGDGKQTRSFQYVDDLVNGMALLMASDYPYPVNIGNPGEITILEFAEIVNELTNNPGGIQYLPQDRIEGDPQRRQPAIGRAAEVLGWKPTISVQDGLAKTINYFREYA